MTDIELINKYVPVNKQKEALKKLENNIPVQYIIGNVDFCGNELIVNENVLIPRFETESLVEKLINYINNTFDRTVKIADLGTGSGAIAISLKKEVNCTVHAYDISEEALKVAKQNIINNKVEIKLFKHDIRNKLLEKYDVIVSNPPYIDKQEEVDSLVHNNEPHLALYANDSGLEFYKSILSYAKEVLNTKSIIAFEIGSTQGNAIQKEAKKYFPFAIINVEQDLTGRTRFIFIINE